MDILLHVFIWVFDEWVQRFRECIDSVSEYLSIDQPASLDLLPMDKHHPYHLQLW
jgi:hypothetical protein